MKFSLRVKPSRAHSKRMSRYGIKDYLIVIAGLFSLLATLLTLTGFGVSLAVDEFSVTHSALLGSSFDLLDLSSWAVLSLLSTATNMSFWKFYLSLLASALPGIIVAYILLASLVLYLKFPQVSSSVIRTSLRFISHLKPKKEDGSASWLIKIAIFCTFGGLILPVFYLAAIASALIIGSILLIAPVSGYFVGKTHIAEHVVKPTSCALNKSHLVTTTDRKSGASREYATCVSVQTGKDPERRGRVVFSTSTAIILYDPTSGKTTRIPMRDAVIESIDKI